MSLLPFGNTKCRDGVPDAYGDQLANVEVVAPRDAGGMPSLLKRNGMVIALLFNYIPTGGMT